jgi:hypothetical protein
MKKIVAISLLITLLMPNLSAQAATKSLKNKGNKISCKSIKTNYKSEIISKWSDGLASDSDVLKEIDFNIKMLSEKQKSTTGKIKKIIGTWIQAEKNTKAFLIDKDVEKITYAMNLKIVAITSFDKICKIVEK